MSNPIKYSTGTESLALKKGNFYIGTGDVGKGPTSSTGYYNGITPPSNGYTVYLNKESGGPSIYTCNNDNQLISLTNIISNLSLTTVSECLNWFATQSDKSCVNRDYESISTNELILNLDPGYTNSYPRVGTTYYDTSISSNNTQIFNNPIFNQSVSDGVFSFDGADDYMDVGSNINLSGNCTFVIWVKPNSFWTSFSVIIENGQDASNLNWRIQRASTLNNIQFYDNVYISGGPSVDYDSYQQFVVICNYTSGTTGSVEFYKNGVKHNQVGIFRYPLHKSTFSPKTIIGKVTTGGAPYRGELGMVQIYDRVLGDDEILSLYNQQKSRFLTEITPTPTPTPTLTPFFTPTPSSTPGVFPNIPTESLELLIDATITLSYPGSGDIWYDISGNNNNATLVNGPTFSDGAILFDGSNDYAIYSYGATAAMTIITIGYSRQSSWNNFASLGSSRTNNGFIIHNDAGSLNTRYFISTSAAGNTFVDYVFPASVNVMRMYSVSTNGTNSHKRYLDSSLVGTNTTGITRGTSNNTGYLAWDSPFSRYGFVGIRAHIIYNRQLSDAEITQIFNNYFP